MNRTITTAAELEALPVGSVVLDRDHWPMWRTSRDGWCASNGTRGIEWPEIERDGVPLTVLHDPSAPAPAPSVVSDAAVEAAARAMAGVVSVGKDYWRATARLALRAALPFLGAAPSATREDLTGIINDAAFEGVEHGRAERVAAYLHDRFTITPRTDR